MSIESNFVIASSMFFFADFNFFLVSDLSSIDLKVAFLTFGFSQNFNAESSFRAFIK